MDHNPNYQDNNHSPPHIQPVLYISVYGNDPTIGAPKYHPYHSYEKFEILHN